MDLKNLNCSRVLRILFIIAGGAYFFSLGLDMGVLYLLIMYGTWRFMTFTLDYELAKLQRNWTRGFVQQLAQIPDCQDNKVKFSKNQEGINQSLQMLDEKNSLINWPYLFGEIIVTLGVFYGLYLFLKRIYV